MLKESLSQSTLTTGRSVTFTRTGYLASAFAKMKSLKEICPYELRFKEFIDNYIKYDITDFLKLDEYVPEAGSAFHVETPLNGGRYTGWMKNGMANGPGTWISDDTWKRTDGMWKDDYQVRTGRRIVLGNILELQSAVQGVFGDKSEPTEKCLRYNASNKIFQWNPVVARGQLVSLDGHCKRLKLLEAENADEVFASSFGN